MNASAEDACEEQPLPLTTAASGAAEGTSDGPVLTSDLAVHTLMHRVTHVLLSAPLPPTAVIVFLKMPLLLVL